MNRCFDQIRFEIEDAYLTVKCDPGGQLKIIMNKFLLLFTSVWN